MAERVPAANTGTAFIGGAQSRNLAPPTVIGQGIPPASTNVGSPIGGVNPSQMKQARPNEGSNIGIPYSRLVPLQNRNALFAPKTALNFNADQTGARNKLVTETEDLRATTLAFVLGLRGSTGNAASQRGLTGGTAGNVLGEGPEAPVYNGHNVGLQPAIMPGMVGTERFQQLCSLEYLHAYFHNVLSGKTIALDAAVEDVKNSLDISDRTSGVLGELLVRNVDMTGSKLTSMSDMAKSAAMPFADVKSEPDIKQGIFTRDFGPFLMGKGGPTKLVAGTKDNQPTDKTQPYQFSRNLGDDLAFSLLDSLIAQQGLTDWRPDGIVLSKGVNDPSDKLSDEYLEARDGQLYNLRVQGPAIGTTWTGDRSMETLPMDKVFVLLVADVWFDVKSESDPLQKLLGKDGITTKEAREAYDKEAEAALKETWNEAVFKTAQKNAWAGTETPVLANFRIVPSTSSQMINYSKYKDQPPAPMNDYNAKRPKLEGMSRMGLRLSNRMGQYVVGGWQIGNVLDTSASRAAMPQGSNIGVRTAPNSSALNINVNIGWWTADRLCRAFNNRDGTITPRHVKPKDDIDFSKVMGAAAPAAAAPAAAAPAAAAPAAAAPAAAAP